MAHFRAVIQGSRGDVSRLGTKASGVVAEACGWEIGGRVTVTHKDGFDIVRLYVTAGSNRSGSDTLVGTYKIGQGETFTDAVLNGGAK